MADYMEQLRREREGLPPKEEGEETPQTEEAKAEAKPEAKPEPPQAPMPDLSRPRVMAKATLFAMQRPQLDQIDDYDSEEEEEKEVLAEQV